MGTRGWLTARVTGLIAGMALAASVLAPASAASAAPASPAAPAASASSAAPAASASSAKVMTAYLVLKAGNLNREITVPAAVTGYVRAHDASNAGLRPGDRLTANELLYALLLPSGADAAYALAQAYGPGLTAFVAKMNATARLLGMSRTHFSNFDGLPYPTPYSNYSTAANLLTLGRAAMLLPAFRSVVDTRSYRLGSGSGHRAYLWKNLNALLTRYPGAIGIKPGYTGAAGQCLLFEASRKGHILIGVTLHSPGSISSINVA